MNIFSDDTVTSYYIHEILVNPDESVTLYFAPADSTKISLNLRFTSSENELIAEKIRLSKR